MRAKKYALPPNSVPASITTSGRSSWISSW